MERCTKALIYRDNLKYNFDQIRRHIAPGVRICAAVKADGYGHGAVTAAEAAVESGAEFLAVASAEEGAELREAGIKARILLLSLCTPDEFQALADFDITPLVFSREYIDGFAKAARTRFGRTGQKIPVHLAVDTGMGRIGCLPQEAGAEAAAIRDSGTLELEGMCTHFAVSDGVSPDDRSYTARQFDLFLEAVENVRRAGMNPGIRHCANSAVIMTEPRMHLDMVRPGIIIYGYYPGDVTEQYLRGTGADFPLRPVMALETRVLAVRKFRAGDSVSYGRTWSCGRDTEIAVLPVGYADGILRRFSPGMQVTINGRNYPVRGRICMDQCMVELGNGSGVRPLDRAVIFGPAMSGALRTAEDLAADGGTISYEVLTSVSRRVTRTVV